jgi:hypothetical protein
MTPHMILAAVALALSALLTVGSIFATSSAVSIPSTDLKVAPKKGDLTIFQGDVPIKPLVAELGGQPQANPFTLRASGPPPSRLPAPPPPPLDLPVPPILPLPEK